MPFSTVGDNATEIESIQSISDKGGHILLRIDTNTKVKLRFRGRDSLMRRGVSHESVQRTLRAPVVNVYLCKR